MSSATMSAALDVGASRPVTPEPFRSPARRASRVKSNAHRACRSGWEVSDLVPLVSRGAHPLGAVGHAEDRAADAGTPPPRARLAAALAAATLAWSAPAFAEEALAAASLEGATAHATETLAGTAAEDERYERVSPSAPSAGDVVPADPSRVPARRGETVLDYGRVFAKTPEALAKVREDIARVERSTGWRLRVVTGNGPGGVGAAMPSANDLYRYFGTEDRKLVIMTVDEFNGNVLDFYNDQSALAPIVPKSVVQEIRGRYGNKYFVDEEGLEEATVAAAAAMSGCLGKAEGCKFVPGLSQQQREFSLIAVVSGGFLFGAASRGVTKSGDTSSPWAAVFGFIWIPWVGMFGFYPLYARQPEDLTPLWENLAIFAACVLATRAGSGVFGTDDEGDAGRTLGGSDE